MREQVPPATRSIDDAIRENAVAAPLSPAYIEPGGSLTWRAYDGFISLLGKELLERGLGPGDRVGVWMHDGAAVHVALAACNRARLVAVGLGARSGERELEHVLRRSRARALITPRELRGVDAHDVFARLRNTLPDLAEHVLIDDALSPLNGTLTDAGPEDLVRSTNELFPPRPCRPGELVLVNSTSGTTGLPKCVAHDELRWHKFHEYSVDSARLTPDDVCMSVVPAPYGFGLWSAHYTPSFLGTPCLVLPRFDVEQTLTMLEQHRVTVLMAVSTQFIMLLGHPRFASTDLSRLRAMFTGGEAIPPYKAKLFEEQTGCTVVQFYGSNESGALSYTTIDDPQEKRLTTAGKVILEVRVRMFDAHRNEVPLTGTTAQPANNGDIRSLGYLDDPEANSELYTPDGWMLMGDLVTVDNEGYLTVVGRTSDVIIRGGKNISAPAVEAEVATHPAVARCAAVAVPDETFGERVCICVVLHDGAQLSFDELLTHLREREVSVEWLPERMLVMDDLPMSSGGKVAKQVLRDQVARLPNDRLLPNTVSR
ncbi:class I adenylate-forming enzyme family protein [Sphaerimonospora thailandensis]|uniref:Short chain acyl-CoA synthetase n=1 Tax=Sphaerimonospora thailandensis TaxID=795644 RepID=A0A8J3RCW7_9ACTN|nr:class I adenylate-forming enzyme family protein [Sphaerimonospora thailandensis]GIH72404.1 short chain acyl-CoA synthetase [Sphaerimonospora thailandensis]